jgi:hypothetical protein
MSRFGLVIAVALAACGHAPVEPQVLSNRAPGADRGGPPGGDYACRIDEGGYRYPPFRCVIASRGGRVTLEKVEGSVRFRGTVTPVADGFAFDGELYCPWGDCTERVHSVFAADGSGAYHATIESLQSGPARVTLRYTPRFHAIGGDGYGGAAYGGDSYGGAAYGTDRIDP